MYYRFRELLTSFFKAMLNEALLEKSQARRFSVSSHRPVLQKFLSYSESVTTLDDDELCQLLIDLQSSGFIFSSHPFDYAISKGLYQEFLSRFTCSTIGWDGTATT
jgi:hypothetical protein